MSLRNKMSRWITIEKDDISIDKERDGIKMNILVDSDDQGNIWAEIDIEIVKDVIKKYEDENN